MKQEALKRILFIFAKLNPGIRYVQGMNEVLAPLYYVFKTDVDEMNAVSASSLDWRGCKKSCAVPVHFIHGWSCECI